MNDELRKCVFCGHEVKLTSGLVRMKGMPKMYFVECDHCGAVVSFRGSESKEDCRKMYNGDVEEGIERWQKLM